MLRSRIEILADILEAARRGATKTTITSKANLNQKLVDHSIRLLIELKLLKQLTKENNSPVSYVTTNNGFQFLEKYRQLQKTLEK
jgi:predicted transcriptional regulator